MGSYINFKNFGAPVVNTPLARQSSIYSLTFDELHNTLGGVGKDFGSMNMDELLKNIWSAEETQAMASSTGLGEESIPSGNLQKQGSLTLPRTLSQKTVDEVWRDLLKENGGLEDGNSNEGSNLQQRQATLGEMTLEEFLLRVGVVGEATQTTGRPNNGGFFGEVLHPNNNNTGTFGFQQPARNNGSVANQIMQINNGVPNLSPSLALNTRDIRSSQQLQPQQQPQAQLQPLYPKQATVPFASTMHLVNNAQLTNPGTRGPIVVRADPSLNTALGQSGVLQSGATGMAGLGTGVTTVATVSPTNQLSSNVIPKSNLDTSSLSPSPYPFSEGTRGRKCSGALEKVVERRRRRMIKNRESAARSRARKQAYTVELEAEIAKLKEMNHDLEKKQAEFMEMQKDQMLEKMKLPWGRKRICLRRTLTGPW